MERNASVSEVRSEGETISDCNLLWNSVMYMNICSLQCKNREMRKGKGRTIKRTKRESKMTSGTNVKGEKPEEWRGKAKGVIKLNTFGCLRNDVPSLRRLAQI
jgi:hypothetical protein